MDRFSMAYAILATQQALLGIVTPELMAVEISLSFEDEKLLTTFYFDQKVSEEILELCSAASTEVSANLCCFSENRFAYLQANDNISPRGQLAYLRLQPSRLDTEPTEFLSREIVHSEEKPALFIRPINGESIGTSYQLVHKTADRSETLPAIPKTANIDIPLPTFVELSLQKALLGRVSRQLRAVTTEYNELKNQFSIRFYYDGEASESLIALWEYGLSEIIAAAWPFAEFQTEIIRLDAPQSIPKEGVIKYLRHEL